MAASSPNQASKANWVTEQEDYPFTIGASDWDDYATHRVKLSPAMIASWLQYHKNHGGKFDAAHDIGAGTYASSNLSTSRNLQVH